MEVIFPHQILIKSAYSGRAALLFSATYFPSKYAQSIKGMTGGQGRGANFNPALMKLNGVIVIRVLPPVFPLAQLQAGNNCDLIHLI